MTELETLERAKMYMEKLANGINPIDGSMIPDGDIVNNVRISRCFFYVADVLGKVIDNSGVAASKKQKKAAFFLSAEKRGDFAFSSTPIPVSEISKRINALIDSESMSTLSYSSIRDWLISLGMLEEIPDGSGKSAKYPTPQGGSIGILMEERMGNNGAYFVVVYTLDAQHFIIDNLDAIIEFSNAGKENQGQPWTAEHDQCLRDLYQQNVPVKDIAATLKRNSGAIRARLKKLGMIQ